MKKKVALLAIVLAVPLVALGVAKGIQLKYESDWRSVLARAGGALTEEQRAVLSLRNICTNPKTAVKTKVLQS